MKMLLYFFIFCIIGWSHNTVYSRSIFKSKEQICPVSLVRYLEKYGYLTKNHEKYEIFQSTIKLQRFMRLSTSGSFSREIKNLLTKPRCGELDIGNQKHPLLKRENGKPTVRYTIKRWSKNIAKEVQNETVWKSMKSWTNILPIEVTWDSNYSNVNIYFVKGQLNKKERGIGPVLSKLWYNGSYNIFISDIATTSVYKLSEVFTHVFGHVLGENHNRLSSVRTPIFGVPLYYGNLPRNSLAFCQPRITSVFSYTPNGKTYMFKDDIFWRVTNKNIAKKGYPKLISEEWHGLPDTFDEVFVNPSTWNTYFFKGSVYYRYNSTTNNVSEGYPYPISKGWIGVPDNIDAALIDLNYSLVFFKGDSIYKFNSNTNQVEFGYPTKIKDIYPGVPSFIDTAFRSYNDAKMYFFKDVFYWRWNEKLNHAEGPFLINSTWRNLC